MKSILKSLPLAVLAFAIAAPSHAGVIRFAAKTSVKAAKPVAELAAKSVKLAAKAIY